MILYTHKKQHTYLGQQLSLILSSESNEKTITITKAMKKFMFTRPGVACVTGAWKNMGTRKNGARVGDILLPSACIRGVPFFLTSI